MKCQQIRKAEGGDSRRKKEGGRVRDDGENRQRKKRNLKNRLINVHRSRVCCGVVHHKQLADLNLHFTFRGESAALHMNVLTSYYLTLHMHISSASLSSGSRAFVTVLC